MQKEDLKGDGERIYPLLNLLTMIIIIFKTSLIDCLFSHQIQSRQDINNNTIIFYIMIYMRAMFGFCKFRYFQPIAQYLKVNKVPPINQEVINSHQTYYLVGFRKVQQLEDSNTQTNQKQRDNTVVQYVKDQFSREALKSEQILRLASELDLDVCWINENENEVGFQGVRKGVYRMFFEKNIYKSKSKRKYKEIRVPEKIQDFDIKNKVKNIERLISRGETRFKIYTQNSSEESEQALKKMLKLLGRENSQIDEKQMKSGNRMKERLIVELKFDYQPELDYDKINKKWKRLIIEKDRKKTEKSQGFDKLDQEDIQIQKHMIRQLRNMGMNLPKSYQKYQELEEHIEKGEKYFYEKVYQKTKNNMQKTKQTRTSEEIVEEEKKEMRKSLGMRTVEEILEEMDKVKGESYEMGPFENYRYKRLEKQLKETLARAGYEGKI